MKGIALSDIGVDGHAVVYFRKSYAVALCVNALLLLFDIETVFVSELHIAFQSNFVGRRIRWRYAIIGEYERIRGDDPHRIFQGRLARVHVVLCLQQRDAGVGEVGFGLQRV